MIKVISEERAFEKLRRDFSLKRSCIFVGAGVSMVRPSKLPSGPELKDLVVNSIIGKLPMISSIQTIQNRDIYRNIVPELLFQDLYTIIGDRFFTIYKLLGYAVPNSVHQALSKLSEGGAKIFTTNFDLLIESCSSKKNHNVIHLHGSIDDLKKLMVLIYQVGKGLNAHFQQLFNKETAGQTLFVMGYSGNDIDVISLINHSQVKVIFWLAKDVRDPRLLANLSKITDVNIYLFQFEIRLVPEKLGIKVYAKPQSNGLKQRKIVLEEFENSLTIFHKYATLAALARRVGEHHIVKRVCKYALKYKTYQTRTEKLWFVSQLVQNARLTGRDVGRVKDLAERELKQTKNLDAILKGELYNSIGLLYLESFMLQPGTGLKYFNLTASIFSKCAKTGGDKTRKDSASMHLARSYNNIGLCHYLLKNYSQAIANLKKAVKLKQRQGNQVGLAMSYVNLSLSYSVIGKPKQSDIWRIKANAIIDKFEMYYVKSVFLQERGKQLIEEDKVQARFLLEEALRILETHLPSVTNDIKQLRKHIRFLSR